MTFYIDLKKVQFVAYSIAIILVARWMGTRVKSKIANV